MNFIITTDDIKKAIEKLRETGEQTDHHLYYFVDHGVPTEYAVEFFKNDACVIVVGRDGKEYNKGEEICSKS